MSLDIYLVKEMPTNVHEANITHNLGPMAAAAGIYQHLWQPDELGIKVAGDLIAPLEAGLERLKCNPMHFSTFNAPNGWGKYEHLVKFVEDYLAAARSHPTATVRAER